MYNVLLASNKIAYRALFRKMLELHCNEQYVSFSTAKDGFEGIEKITNGEYTLVIIDINDFDMVGINELIIYIERNLVSPPITLPIFQRMITIFSLTTNRSDIIKVKNM